MPFGNIYGSDNENPFDPNRSRLLANALRTPTASATPPVVAPPPPPPAPITAPAPSQAPVPAPIDPHAAIRNINFLLNKDGVENRYSSEGEILDSTKLDPYWMLADGDPFAGTAYHSKYTPQNTIKDLGNGTVSVRLQRPGEDKYNTWDAIYKLGPDGKGTLMNDPASGATQEKASGSSGLSGLVMDVHKALAKIPGGPAAAIEGLRGGLEGDLSWNPYSKEGPSVWDYGAGGTKFAEEDKTRAIGRAVGTAVGGAFAGPALSGALGGGVTGAAGSGALLGGTQAALQGGDTQSIIKAAIMGAIASGAKEYFNPVTKTLEPVPELPVDNTQLTPTGQYDDSWLRDLEGLGSDVPQLGELPPAGGGLEGEVDFDFMGPTQSSGGGVPAPASPPPPFVGPPEMVGPEPMPWELPMDDPGWGPNPSDYASGDPNVDVPTEGPPDDTIEIIGQRPPTEGGIGTLPIMPPPLSVPDTTPLEPIGTEEPLPEIEDPPKLDELPNDWLKKLLDALRGQQGGNNSFLSLFEQKPMHMDMPEKYVKALREGSAEWFDPDKD